MNTQPGYFKTLRALTLAGVLGGIGLSLASAASIDINPIKDNTLYEYVPADGDSSNALGNHFFAGETAMSEIRRGVLAFDIAGNIPAGSTITGVSLSMNMSRTPSDTNRTVELHLLLADWGEGTSHAPLEEGDGAPATTNDATWRHRFFDTIFWTTQGGDFSGTVSASQSVGAIGEYVWSSAPMVADVQSWLDNSANNFGWLVLGDESAIATAKRFDTRESTSPPVLSIEYTLASTPTPTPTPTPTVTPTPTPTPGGITLSAHGRRVQGRHTVDLTWSPVTSANIDIYRNGVVIATVPNNGAYKDFIGVRGGNARYTYKVCDAGTSNCSNEVTVRFGGPPL
jgi:hypothetical protein